MGNSESKKKKDIKDDKENDVINPFKDDNDNNNDNNDNNGHSIEDQKNVGYIVDKSDTEKQWLENNPQEEEKEEKKNEEPEEYIEPDKQDIIEEKEKTKCKLCRKHWLKKECYSLETCGHIFCFECIKNFLCDNIDVSVNEMPTCPRNKCDAPISIGDLKKALDTFRNEEENEKKAKDPVVSAIRESVGVFPVKLTQSLELFVDQMDYLIKCPSCKLIFEKVPLSAMDSRLKEVVKDDKGKILSGESLQHYLENRFRCRNCSTVFCSQCYTSPYHLGYTCRTYLDSLHKNKCRYCQEPVPQEYSCYTHEQQNETWVTRWKKRRMEKRKKSEINFDINDKQAMNEFIAKKEKEMEAAGQFYVCDDEECQIKAADACLHTTNCKHLCGGVKDEVNHLPCLKESCVNPGDTNIDDYCNICWVEDLGSAPSILLKCGHYFHYRCIKTRIDRGYSTPYISFKFATCPLCNLPVDHPLLDTKEIRELEAIIKDLGVRRLKAEMMMDDPDLLEGGAYHGKEGEYAILKLTFYKCDRCKKPYYGGKKECGANVGEEEAGENFNPKDLICPACAGINANCDKHGTEYIEFKCRFCCSLATYFCGGKAHFCTPCHDVAGEKVDFSDWSTKWSGVIECPGYEKCPFGAVHAMNGEEACLGCAMCKAEQS